MGNCIEKCPEKKEQVEQHHQQESVEMPSFLLPEEKPKGGAMRLKIVLTKEELQLLLLQLKKNEEGQNQAGKKKKKKPLSLEDVLNEIERSRRRSNVSFNVISCYSSSSSSSCSSASWKPSLDSIVETYENPPEVPERMDRL